MLAVLVCAYGAAPSPMDIRESASAVAYSPAGRQTWLTAIPFTLPTTFPPTCLATSLAICARALAGTQLVSTPLADPAGCGTASTPTVPIPPLTWDADAS